MAEVNILNHTNIIHTKISEKITTEDYEQMVPFIQRIVDKYDSVRWIYELQGKPSMEPGAMWKDAKTSMKYFTKFEKVVLIAERDWIEKATKIGDSLVPFEMKYFGSEDAAQAYEWIKS
ncbi:SpoIIAA family protein [Portibacter marinus]|uniref:STAS/SEC14 domain-containing protein n=1 Tax=Portibacter marinus TaxID=2898660 RepID=UPI001F192F9C|nr:STAS/SEC14 domain-containing protein [Portibacter marinus]